MKIKKLIFLVVAYFLCINLIGCDAFVRKFTRKKKTTEGGEVEMVLAPVEYKAPFMTKEEQYRQSFLYWQSWQGELIEALTSSRNYKKTVDCVNQSLEQLNNLKLLLSGEYERKAAYYYNRLAALKGRIANDIYFNEVAVNRMDAERIRRDIFRDLSVAKVKNSFK